MRNSVLEVRRRANIEDFSYQDNLADIPSRGAGAEDVGPGSKWQDGCHE